MITTPSGTYKYEDYKEIENRLKKAFKDYWHKKITIKELLQIKEQSGFINAEIEGAQYSASFEDREEEKKGEQGQ